VCHAVEDLEEPFPHGCAADGLRLDVGVLYCKSACRRQAVKNLADLPEACARSAFGYCAASPSLTSTMSPTSVAGFAGTRKTMDA